MQSCEHCHVKIRTKHKTCPLCHGHLSGDIDTCETIFPMIPDKGSMIKKVIKFVTFLCIAAAILCTGIFLMLEDGFRLALYVDTILFFIWVISCIGILKRNNILKIIMYEAVLLIIASAVFDNYIEGIHITLNYTYPCVCIVSLLAAFLYIKHQKLGEKEFIIYVLMINVAAILPGIFLLLGLITFKILSVICILLNLIVFAALLIFRTESVKNELSKKLHV